MYTNYTLFEECPDLLEFAIENDLVMENYVNGDSSSIKLEKAMTQLAQAQNRFNKSTKVMLNESDAILKRIIRETNVNGNLSVPRNLVAAIDDANKTVVPSVDKMKAIVRKLPKAIQIAVNTGDLTLLLQLRNDMESARAEMHVFVDAARSDKYGSDAMEGFSIGNLITKENFVKMKNYLVSHLGAFGTVAVAASGAVEALAELIDDPEVKNKIKIAAVVVGMAATIFKAGANLNTSVNYIKNLSANTVG